MRAASTDDANRSAAASGYAIADHPRPRSRRTRSPSDADAELILKLLRVDRAAYCRHSVVQPEIPVHVA